jgi:hypothetical protein
MRRQRPNETPQAVPEPIAGFRSASFALGPPHKRELSRLRNTFCSLPRVATGLSAEGVMAIFASRAQDFVLLG